MNSFLSPKINKLIDQLFVYNANHQSIVEHLIAFGQDAVPHLLAAIRKREFRHAQNQINTNQNTFRHIARALIGIKENEKDPLLKDQISLQIIDEMAAHVSWQIENSAILISSREGLESYRKAFDDNLFNKACESAWALGQLKDGRALPHLLRVIKDRDSHPTIRENAIIALGLIGSEEAIPHLIELVDNHDFNSHFAIDALIEIKSSTAVPLLINSLNNRKIQDIEAHIIWALGQLRDLRATSTLNEWVKTHSADMKAVAIQALGNIGDFSAIPVLKACLDDVTILNRNDHGGTLWLFRSYRGRTISEMALAALQEIGTPDALKVIEEWRSSQAHNTAG
jgi:HEAT repeat protein